MNEQEYKNKLIENSKKYRSTPGNAPGTQDITDNISNSRLFDVSPNTVFREYPWSVMKGKTEQDCYDSIRKKWDEFEILSKSTLTNDDIIKKAFKEINKYKLAISAYLNFDRAQLNSIQTTSQIGYKKFNNIAKTPKNPRDFFYAQDPSMSMFMSTIKEIEKNNSNKTKKQVNSTASFSKKTNTKQTSSITTLKQKHINKNAAKINNRKQLNCNGVGAPHVIAAHANGSI